MKILNTSFSKEGWAWFTGLPKADQKKWISAKNPEYQEKEIDKFLKDVPHGKHSTGTKSSKKSGKGKSVKKVGKGNNPKQPANEGTEDSGTEKG